jgi:cholesterol oxidase
MRLNQPLARSLDQLRPSYDVVVIGSGYGGGVTAARLARAGKRVCVLERGKEFPTGSFPSKFPELRSEMQVRGRNLRTGPDTALYDVRLGDDMHVLVGCGLGGGSLVNAGVALRPDARVFADMVWPGEIARDGTLDEGFRRAERWLRPSVDPTAHERTKFQSLVKAGKGIGATPIAPRVAVSFADTINPAGIAQAACTRCGDCCGGCNVGAKNTVAMTYLPEAAKHSAEIFTHAKVSHVSKARDGSWRVHLARLDAAKGQPANLIVEGAIVVLAAGTLGSTEILLRSRGKGLSVSDRLGERFSANGDIIAFGFGAKVPVDAIGVGHPARVEMAPIGASVSGQIEINDPDNLNNSLCIQEGAIPSALASALPYMFLPNGRLLGALQSLISGVYKGPFANLQTFFAVSHDSASGKFSLDGDRLALSWPGAKDEAVYKRLDELLGRLVGEVGGSYVKNPLAGTVMGHQPATAHPLGGAGMGSDRNHGAVDHKCRAFDGSAVASNGTHDGLYVIDGAVIPRSLGVNPLLTITALSERAMLHMAEDYGLSCGDVCG